MRFLFIGKNKLLFNQLKKINSIKLTHCNIFLDLISVENDIDYLIYDSSDTAVDIKELIYCFASARIG